MNTNFLHKVIDLDENGNIVMLGTKNLYNIDDKIKLSDWCREPIKNIKEKVEFPNLSSGIKISENNIKKYINSIGCFASNSDCVVDNQIFVNIFTSCNNQEIGIPVFPQNFLRCVTAFTARLVIQDNWINSNDEYTIPNESHPKFKQFQNDSIIFSLFTRKSQQSSLRNITYHNKKWNIKNNFFWLSNNCIKQLSEKHNMEITYNDCIQFPEDPYLHTVLISKLNNPQQEPFSNQARVVLSKATNLLVKTFPYRKEFTDENPEYQCNNWDIGWYQIKAMCKKYFLKEYDEFRKEYLKFRDELRPLVYELGFLK